MVLAKTFYTIRRLTAAIGESFPVRVAGPPFVGGNKKRPYGQTDKPTTKSSLVDHVDDDEVEGEDEVKRKEVINNNINGAIVESIPGNKLTAEELDPETK